MGRTIAALAVVLALAGCTAAQEAPPPVPTPSPTVADQLEVADAEYAEVVAKYELARKDANLVLVQTYSYEVLNGIDIDTTRMELLKLIPVEDSVKEMRAMTGKLNWETLNLRYLIGEE